MAQAGISRGIAAAATLLAAAACARGSSEPPEGIRGWVKAGKAVETGGS